MVQRRCNIFYRKDMWWLTTYQLIHFTVSISCQNSNANNVQLIFMTSHVKTHFKNLNARSKGAWTSLKLHAFVFWIYTLHDRKSVMLKLRHTKYWQRKNIKSIRSIKVKNNFLTFTASLSCYLLQDGTLHTYSGYYFKNTLGVISVKLKHAKSYCWFWWFYTSACKKWCYSRR